MVEEITFLIYSINKVNKCILTSDMTEYIANIANMLGTEENQTSFFQRRRKVHFLEHCLTSADEIFSG